MPLPSHADLHGSPVEEVTLERGFSAQRKLICAWNDRLVLAEGILGQAYPYVIDSPAIARRAAIEPVPAKQDGEGEELLSAYAKAIITISYDEGEGGTRFPVESGYFEDFIPTMEYGTLGFKDYFWLKSSGPPVIVESVDEGPAKQFYGGEYIRKRFGLTKYPKAHLAFIGTINKSSVLTVTSYMDGLSFDAGTLLFQPPTIEYERQPDSSFKLNVSYRLLYKPQTHNKFWRTIKPAGWYPMVDYAGVEHEIHTPIEWGTL